MHSDDFAGVIEDENNSKQIRIVDRKMINPNLKRSRHSSNLLALSSEDESSQFDVTSSSSICSTSLSSKSICSDTTSTIEEEEFRNSDFMANLNLGYLRSFLKSNDNLFFETISIMEAEKHQSSFTSPFEFC